jgi:hypothetical protein
MEARLLLLPGSIGRIMLLAAALLAALVPMRPALAANQVDIPGPAGSGSFGRSVTVLANGNIVVTDPYYDAGAMADVGAVYLYDGATGAQISMLTGSTAGDRVGAIDEFGSSGVTPLGNGNWLVFSPYWDNGPATDAGAVTWSSGTSGVSGVVSATNSLVGSTAGDRVGDHPWLSHVPGVMVLRNGNYLVFSTLWDNGVVADAGAVTWGSGTAGVQGAVSAANSLVGSSAGDQVGGFGATALINGNYVVSSPGWDNGPQVDAGAVTWGSGTTGVTGQVSAANSLVGSTADDYIGYDGVTALSNGSYVVRSSSWDHGAVADAGAVTWGDGMSGVHGVVSAANSLAGTTADDHVGSGCVTELTNGNYLTFSPDWDNGAAADAGAVTWGDGATGIVGVVSAANSLVGSTAGDRVGNGHVRVLSNGNYVVLSSLWDNGATMDAGAVTWGRGTSGVKGAVSEANSLVGSTTGDQVGSAGLWALSNGNYVVCSSNWDNGAAADAGAVTWGSGITGVKGAVSEANSLVGSTAGDYVGSGGVIALSNGNYVVCSSDWDNGAAADAGAVTWGDGATGIVGVVSAANSLVGSTDGDYVGWVTALTNGNYVVSSVSWDNGTAVDAGAVTWGNGLTGVRGVVSAVNSLVGSTAGDHVGSGAVTALDNGNYVARSPNWDNGAVADVGAVTWGAGAAGVKGTVSAANSLLGTTVGDRVGNGQVMELSNGSYVVVSYHWDNGSVVDAGAVTWGNGAAGVVGVVSAANSLIGGTAGDMVGSYLDGSHRWPAVTVLSSSDYVVRSPDWDNGAATNAGAVTWGDRTGGTIGPITADNSVRGTAENGGGWMVWACDKVNHQLVVGRPADNIVTLFRLPPVTFYPVFLPVVLRNAP